MTLDGIARTLNRNQDPHVSSLLRFDDVTLGYASHPVLSGVSFELIDSDFLGIVGPNGSGKTTLLRAILNILPPMSGSIVRSDETGNRFLMGYVPQRDAIDPFLPFTVADIVMMGRYGHLGLIRRPGREDRLRVSEQLEHVGIADLAHRSFRELSGGQKQRTLIARALASEPKILVLDEPTNGMDMSSRTSILRLLKHLHAHDGLTIVLVSHLLSDIANFVNRIAFIDGATFLMGTVEEMLTPQRLSEMYHMPIDVQSVAGSTVIIPGERR